MRNSIGFLSLVLGILVVVAAIWQVFFAGNESLHINGADGAQRVLALPAVDSAESAAASRRASSRTPGFDDVPAGRAIDIVERLGVSAKRGDADAAFRIYAKLSRCFDHASHEVTEQIRAAYRSAGVGDEELDRAGRRLRDDCQGAEQLVASRGEWLELAAGQGDPEGMMLYAADPAAILGDGLISEMDPERVADYVERSVAFMDGLVDQGDPGAMLALSIMYGASELMPHDRVRSAAYRLAAERVAPLEVPSKPIGLAMTGLTVSQQEEAHAIAQEIGSRCCRH